MMVWMMKVIRDNWRRRFHWVMMMMIVVRCPVVVGVVESVMRSIWRSIMMRAVWLSMSICRGWFDECFGLPSRSIFVIGMFFHMKCSREIRQKSIIISLSLSWRWKNTKDNKSVKMVDTSNNIKWKNNNRIEKIPYHHQLVFVYINKRRTEDSFFYYLYKNIDILLQNNRMMKESLFYCPKRSHLKLFFLLSTFPFHHSTSSRLSFFHFHSFCCYHK